MGGNMPKFSETSQARLATCHPDLIRLMEHVIKDCPIDFTILCGHRGKEEQDKAFREGKSRARYPASRHNATPSQAVDIAPWPINWKDTERFARLAGYVQRCAQELGIAIKWGGEFTSLKDMPHFELA